MVAAARSTGRPGGSGGGSVVSLENWQIVALIGAVVLLISVFCPVVNYSRLGPGSLINGGAWPGVVILILAIVAGVFAVLRETRVMIGAAGIALLIGAVKLIEVLSSMRPSEPSSGLEQLFGGLSALTGTVSVSWGWAVLFIGAGTVIGASFGAKKAS